MPPSFPVRARSLVLLASALLALPTPGAAAAQLRPLEPFDWRVFAEGRTVTAQVGGAYLADQRAALAGTEGPLVEAGSFTLTWRTGRVALEGAGTVQRFFREDRRFAPATERVLAAEDGRRHDSGDLRVSTVVRLTPEGAPAAAVLRFGARLPTTDDRTGLDRDATDFFALVGGRWARGATSATAEAGVSINGTRDPGFEQSDVLAYAARVDHAVGPVVLGLATVGQVDGIDGSIRGNEDLGEVRFGGRTEGRTTLRVEGVAGYQRHSPRAGILVAVGVAR